MQQYLYQVTIICTNSCLAHIHLIFNRMHMIHVPGQTRTQGTESSNSVAKQKYLEVHLQNLNWHVTYPCSKCAIRDRMDRRHYTTIYLAGICSVHLYIFENGAGDLC